MKQTFDPFLLFMFEAVKCSAAALVSSVLSFCLQMSSPAVWSAMSWLEDFVMTRLPLVQSAAHSQLLTHPPWTPSPLWPPVTSSLSTTAIWWPEMAATCTATRAPCTPWPSRALSSSRCWVTEVTAGTKVLKDSNQNLPLFPLLFQLLLYLRAPLGPPLLRPKLLPISDWTATSTVWCSGGP